MQETDAEGRSTGAGGTTGSESGPTTGAGGTTGGEGAGGRDESSPDSEGRAGDRTSDGSATSDPVRG